MLFNPSSVAKTVVKGFKGNKVFFNTFTTVTHTGVIHPHTHTVHAVFRSGSKRNLSADVHESE